MGSDLASYMAQSHSFRWTQEYDRDGDVYFEDHNSGLLTYDDPRIVADPEPAKSIPGRLQPLTRQKTAKAFKTRFTVKNKVRVWSHAPF